MLLSCSVMAQWNTVEQRSNSNYKADELPEVYKVYSLDIRDFEAQLEKRSAIVKLPNVKGEEKEYILQYAPVFHPNLVARYPFLKAYKGFAVDNPSESVNIAYTRDGIYAMTLDENGPSTFINYLSGTDHHYVVFDREDFGMKSHHAFECMVDGSVSHDHDHGGHRFGDCQLRRYRLALSCTAEYAQFHGGTVESVLEAYNVAMARVNGVYEREAAITMQLIENTDQLIYFDPNTDPFSNSDGGTMLGQNQTTIDNIIGSNNYDIGHVFSTGGGGIASLRSPCGSRKAQGVTGQSQPIGDPFTIDYVAHEMGHQFGANHTQNNGCNRVQATAMEPGSASTIMGYAGICAPNVQSNSNDYFHAISLEEIADFVTTSGNVCAEIVPTTNSAPTVTVASDSYVIPASTSFLLEAIGSDAEGDMLTYCWEQMDNEVATMPPLPTNTGGPMFRSLSPTTNPIRYFGSITNPNPTWEVLPSVSRNMSFNCTVRDNNTMAGCTNSVGVEIEVDGNSGPFVVNAPNGGELWKAGETQAVTWDVAGTDQAPVNADLVDIYLSIDGGENFDILVAENVPNDGSQQIIVPSQKTNLARIMVRGNDNIFYDVSNSDFQITAQFSIAFDPTQLNVCQENSADAQVTIDAFDGFMDLVSLSLGELPDGMTGLLSESTVSPPANITLSINNLDEVTPGDYIIEIFGSTDVEQAVEYLPVRIENRNIAAVSLLAPLDGTIDTGTELELSWEELPGVSSYTVEVSTNSNFDQSNSYETENTSVVLEALEKAKVYYWRVKATSSCDDGDYGEVRSFRTFNDGCTTQESTDVPIAIPQESDVIINSTIEISEEFNFASAKVFVDIEHSWAGDLIAEVIAPNGTIFTLFDRPGYPNSNFGCDESNIRVTLYNDATQTAGQLDTSCESGDFAVSGDFQAVDAFTSIEGSAGTWTLRVSDAFQQDGGQLVAWSIETCQNVEIPEADISGSRVMNVPRNASASFDDTVLKYNGDEAHVISINTLPASGQLLRSGSNLAQGDVISAADMQMGNIVYQHNGDDAMTDAFYVDVFVPSTGAWLHEGIIQVNIVESGFQAFANIVTQVSCNGASDGVIAGSAIDGVAPYEYSLDGNMFQSNNSFEGLAAGTYLIYVKDANGIVEQSASLTLVDPEAVVLSNTMDKYDVVLSATGGDGNYTYEIVGVGSNVTGVFADVPNGDYEMRVIDGNECMDSRTVTVDIPALAVTTTNVNLLCANVNDGSITVMPTGGVAPYEYSLDNEVYQSSEVYDNLSPGDYIIYARDSGGKIVNTDAITITAPEAIDYNYNVDGDQITITPVGGSGDYTMTIDGEMVSNPVTIDDFDATYALSISDSNGCVYNFDLEFNTINGLNVEYSEVLCAGSNNGFIEVVSVQGGDAPYMFALNGGDLQSSNEFVDLTPGEYTLTVASSTGIVYNHPALTIGENPAIEIATSTSADSLLIMASGGTPPYVYSRNGQFYIENPFFVGLADGNYTIYVRDDAGCVAEITVDYTDVEEILDPISLSVSPNPAVDQVTISTNQLDNWINSVEVYAVDGKLLLAREVNLESELSISVKEMPEGLYLFKIQTDKGSRVEKINVIK